MGRIPRSWYLWWIIPSRGCWYTLLNTSRRGLATAGRPTPVYYKLCPCIPITELSNELNICVHVICEFYINCLSTCRLFLSWKTKHRKIPPFHDVWTQTTCQLGCVYSGINSTKSPASGEGNISKPRLKLQVERVREVACACITVRCRCQYSPAYIVAAVIWLRWDLMNKMADVSRGSLNIKCINNKNSTRHIASHMYLFRYRLG